MKDGELKLSHLMEQLAIENDNKVILK
jgi:hypothetical protein